MALVNSNNVAVGKPNFDVSGGVLAAPLGTELPDSFNGMFNEALKSIGYVSEDGVTESSNMSTDDIKAWGGVKVRTVQTEYAPTLQFTLLESTNGDALRFVFGEKNVTTEDGVLKVRRNAKAKDRLALVLPMLDGENARMLVVPRGQVTEVGDITYVDSEAIAYEVTVTCDPDDNNDNLLEYIEVPEGNDDDDEGEEPGEA